MMKKIFLSLVFVFTISYAAHAQMYVEGCGTAFSAGDAKTQLGYGGSVGFNIAPELFFYTRALYGTAVEEANKPDEIKYSHLTALAVFQYRYSMQMFPLYFYGNFGLGFAKTSIDGKEVTLENVGYAPREKISVNENGVGMSLGVGLGFHISQHITPFAEVYYHKATYVNNDDLSVGGAGVLVGVSFTIFGKNQGIANAY